MATKWRSRENVSRFGAGLVLFALIEAVALSSPGWVLTVGVSALAVAGVALVLGAVWIELRELRARIENLDKA